MWCIVTLNAYFTFTATHAVGIHYPYFIVPAIEPRRDALIVNGHTAFWHLNCAVSVKQTMDIIEVLPKAGERGWLHRSKHLMRQNSGCWHHGLWTQGWCTLILGLCRTWVSLDPGYGQHREEGQMLICVWGTVGNARIKFMSILLQRKVIDFVMSQTGVRCSWRKFYWCLLKVIIIYYHIYEIFRSEIFAQFNNYPETADETKPVQGKLGAMTPQIQR